MGRELAHLVPAPVRDEPDERGEQAARDDGVCEVTVGLDHLAGA